MFLFFLPGADRFPQSLVPKELLRKHGLSEFEDYNRVGDNILIDYVSKHPDLGPGMFLAPRPSGGADPIKSKMSPDITWKFYKPTNHYIGYVKGMIPDPEAFSKEDRFSRYAHSDCKKRPWGVPCIQSPDPLHQVLPTLPVRSFETGEVESRVKEEFRGLWDLTGEIVDRIKTDRLDSDPDWCYEAAMRLLRCNYYLTDSTPGVLQEIGYGLFDSNSAVGILLMACDWQLRSEYLEAVNSEEIVEGEDGTLKKSKDDSVADLSSASSGQRESVA